VDENLQDELFYSGPPVDVMRVPTSQAVVVAAKAPPLEERVAGVVEAASQDETTSKGETAAEYFQQYARQFVNTGDSSLHG
jgi:hypothetical protein